MAMEVSISCLRVVATQGSDKSGNTLRLRLTLVYESTSSAVLEAPDNLHFTPRGGILLCEDGGGLNFVRGLTPAGTIFDFVGHNTSSSECAGATFSPDGQTLFFNYQGTGETFAVWPREGHSWEDGAL
jgi:uncharacterized protein